MNRDEKLKLVYVLLTELDRGLRRIEIAMIVAVVILYGFSAVVLWRIFCG